MSDQLAHSMPDVPSQEVGVLIGKKILLAEAVARDAGTTLTPLRRHVYELLLRSSNPVSAYDMLPYLDGVASVKPATAYRTLDWLEALGLVLKIRSIAKYVALSSGPSERPVAFAICRECGAAEQISTRNSLDLLLGLAKARGFGMSAPVIELVSACAAHSATRSVDQ